MKIFKSKLFHLTGNTNEVNENFESNKHSFTIKKKLNLHFDLNHMELLLSQSTPRTKVC